MKKYLFCALMGLFVTANLSAQDLFNGKMAAGEKAVIDRGDVVIRNIGKPANISINPDVSPAVRRAVDIITKTKPSYLAEVIQVLPYDPALIPRVAKVLLDVPSYKGIPYFSERGQRYYDLYSAATIKSRQASGDTTAINAGLHMEPFNPYDVYITLTQEATPKGASLFYQMENATKITAEDMSLITVAKPRGMQSLIVVFPYEDKLVFYGIGGVNAPVVSFLKERIQVSFINRIKTFCMYVYEKM